MKILEYPEKISKFKLKYQLHCKKRLAVFPSPAGMSLSTLSLAGWGGEIC